MGTDDVTAVDALADFANRFLRDRAEGRQRPLAEYLARYPGHEEGIAREFVALSIRLAGDAEPTRIGDYAIERELGRGGQAVVYLARDLRLPRPVALKILAETGLGAGADALARFGREAAVVSRLAHPGICTVYETGTFAGRPFLAMQWIDGVPLSAHIAAAGAAGTATALPLADGTTTAGSDARTRNFRVLELVEATARALDAAHRAGVVHRDVKPSNILVRRDGTPVLVDFGLAADDAAEQPALTRSGMVFGTPAYMSPEQVRGEHRRPDPRTDVYSLGVTLYEALTGVRPFAAATREALYRLILEGRPEDPCRLNRSLPREARVVVATAMDPDPDHRYQSAAAFADDLLRVRSLQPIRAAPPPLRLRLWRWVQRNPLAAACILLLALGLAVTAGIADAMVGLRRSEQRALEKVDAGVLRDLQADADERLWPELPSMLARLAGWCADVEAVLAPRLSHWQAIPPREGHLGAALAAFLGEGGTLERVRARHARIEAIAAQTAGDGPRWEGAVAAAAAAGRYGPRVPLAPTYGLAPLGVDPRTGLLELWHPRSGAEPRRDGEGRLRIGPETGMLFVLLPAGRCRVGAQATDPRAPRFDPRAEADESPVGEVELSPFLIAKHEVTQGQWERLTGARPSQFHRDSDLARRFPLGDEHPLENVTWEDAARWLARFGLALPTEAQWEYACRAGTDTPWWAGADQDLLAGCANLADAQLHRVYPDRPGEWRVDDGFVLTAPVGALAPNAFGLHDVHGNVAEWCADGPGSFDTPLRPGDGLRAQPDSGYRIARGGYFEQVPAKARSSYRLQLLQTRGDYWLGVRPVMMIPR